MAFHSSKSKPLLAADRGSLSLQLGYGTCCLISPVLQPSQASLSLWPTNSDFLQALHSWPETGMSVMTKYGLSPWERAAEIHWVTTWVPTGHLQHTENKGNVCSRSMRQDLNLACSEHKYWITCNPLINLNYNSLTYQVKIRLYRTVCWFLATKRAQLHSTLRNQNCCNQTLQYTGANYKLLYPIFHAWVSVVSLSLHKPRVTGKAEGWHKFTSSGLLKNSSGDLLPLAERASGQII